MHHMQQAPYASIYKYLGKPKYVPVVVVDQYNIEKDLVDHYDLSLDHE